MRSVMPPKNNMVIFKKAFSNSDENNGLFSSELLNAFFPALPGTYFLIHCHASRIQMTTVERVMIKRRSSQAQG